MTTNRTRSALVTGATSGLGLEAAAQLAEAGYAPITITGRSTEKAAQARAALMERTGLDVFEILAVDLSIPSSVSAALAELATKDQSFDFALLNAGMVPGSALVKTDDDMEITFASSLLGHHQLTMGLLSAGLLSDKAKIVIAGSEASRGDVPTFKVPDLHHLADKSFGGDLQSAAEALIRQESPISYKPGNAYATAKLFVAWWAAALARRLPEGMTVNAVSPGSAPATSAVRNANFFMRRIMMPILSHAPARFGLAASVPVAAGRYVEAADFGDDVSGQFFASAPKKMTGPMQRITLDHVNDRPSQEAAWAATVRLTGVELPSTVE